MAMISTSPTLSAKMIHRESANKIRHGSPKLQEVLRERCRVRMRERRSEFFNRGRFNRIINSNDAQMLDEIVRNELNYIADTNPDPDVNPFVSREIDQIDPEEAIVLENEIIQEEAQWIVQEYEKMMNEEMETIVLAVDDQSDQVICPTCQKCDLVKRENKVGCKSCNFTLNCTNLRDLKLLINNHVEHHSLRCEESPGFLSIPENSISSLFIICEKCSAMSQII